MPINKSKHVASVKATTVQLRLRPGQKDLLVRAAASRQTSLSNFMLEHACEAAQQVLAADTRIVMSQAEWESFQKALDAPPRSIPALKKLLTEPSVFDDQRTATAK
jgi:uncharacterized protein (DUF1778 family)